MQELCILTVQGRDGKRLSFCSLYSLEHARSMAEPEDVELGFQMLPIPDTEKPNAFMGALVVAGWEAQLANENQQQPVVQPMIP